MAKIFRNVTGGGLLVAAVSLAACGPVGHSSSAVKNIKAHENPQEVAFTNAADGALKGQFGSAYGDYKLVKGGVPAVKKAFDTAETKTISGYEKSQGAKVTKPLTPALQAKIKHDLATAMSAAVAKTGYVKTAKDLHSTSGRATLIAQVQAVALPTINHDLGIH